MWDVEVRELEKREYPQWDEMVRASPQGSIFHCSDWITTSARLSGEKPCILGLYKDNILYGGCPIYIRTYYHLLTHASSVSTMTPFGGLCLVPSGSSKGAKQIAHTHALMEAIAAFLTNSYDAVTLINSPDLVDIRPFIWNGWSSSVLFTNYLNVQSALENLSSRSVKTALKRAKTQGITVRQSRDIHQYYELVRKTFERHREQPPVSEQYFQEMMKMFLSRNCGGLWIAETAESETVSAIIPVWDNKRAHAWSAASDPEFKDTGAHSLVFYEICAHLTKAGYQDFNLMTANMRNLATFYSKYRPTLLPYYALSTMTPRSRILVNIMRGLGRLK